jgi:hypothetical protein
MLVHMPMGTDPRPDRKLYDVARRMVQSLVPESGRKGDK